MAPKAQRKVQKITVELGSPQPKKVVTRYDADEGDDDAAMSNAYIRKAALEKIGNPDRVKITIEAA
jgi:hypothetical protein